GLASRGRRHRRRVRARALAADPFYRALARSGRAPNAARAARPGPAARRTSGARAPSRGCARVAHGAGGVTQIAAQGLAMTLPPGWEARIARRSVTHAGERAFSELHCASFPLPEQRDDFGGNFIESMRGSDGFITLFEYGPESVHQPLFAS